jgi:hypothetical protein
MNTEIFIGWLSGILELVDAKKIDEAGAKAIVVSIQDHLKLVVTKVTPDKTKDAAPIQPIYKPAPYNKITPLYPIPTKYPGGNDPLSPNYWLNRENFGVYTPYKGGAGGGGVYC